MQGNHYDIIVIGSGPGGASLAHRLAPTGLKILVLERGGWLKRAAANWDPREVFINNIYQADETWYDKTGKAFHPGLHYFVGGNSKMYGAALFRLRERDFEEVRHADGISPEWPVKYDVFEIALPEPKQDRKSTRLNSSHPSISYAVFCLKKK